MEKETLVAQLEELKEKYKILIVDCEETIKECEDHIKAARLEIEKIDQELANTQNN